MSDDLKRVGLVFKEDGAVDFKKTLQDINIEMNKNYNQFKLTQAQWNNSTKTTEKLRQEQEYLKNAYEIQTDKVNTLKMQLSDLENAENKNTTAIKKKQNELTNAEIKLETYKKKIEEIDSQLKNAGKSIEDFGTKVQNSGKKIEKAGKKVSAFSIATGSAMVASAKTAIDFEEAFTGVEKTVDGTEQQMAELKQGIRDMSKEIPSTTTEISAVAEAAGQLGIKTEDILSFTRVMIDLGNSTNLSAEEAASALAKFANVTKMSAKDYDKLGSTIVALGNNFATTEKDIVEMATRLAATGELAGLSQSQILSLATAMSSVGIEAEAGGSAMSKLLKKIQLATELGGDDLKQFAKVAGMSVTDFKKAYEKDAVKALSAFIGGLNDTKRNGKSAIAILNDMGLTEVRLSNTILSLANASDVMNEAVDLGNKAWEDNTALTNEANKRYDTLKSKITKALNKLKDMAITIGNKLMPHIEKIIDKIGKWIEKFDGLSDSQVDMIVNIGLMIAAIGPLLKILGKITSVTGITVKGFGTFIQAIGVARGNITSTSDAVNGLAKKFSAIASPVGLATIAITGLAAATVYFRTKETEAQKEIREFATEMSNAKKSLEDYNKSIDDTANANISHIDSSTKLREELKLLVDENGKVEEKNKGRVSFILNELNSALGTEYKLNGDIVEGYKELQSEIDKTIEKKKAEIILNAEEEKYKNAIENQKQAIEDLRKAKENLGGASIEVLKAELTALEKMRYGNSQAANELRNKINAYNDAEYRVKTCTENIKSYELDYEKFVSGNYNAINNKITATTQEWCDKSLEDIKNSIKEKSKTLNEYKEIYKQYGNDMAKQQAEQAEQELDILIKELQNRTSTVNELGENEINAWRELATNSYGKYFDVLSNMDPALAKKIQDMTGIIIQRTPEMVSATQNMSQQVLEQIEKNSEFRKIAVNNLQGMLDGLEDSKLKELLKEAGVHDVEKVMQGIRNGNLAEDEGLKILKGLHSGLNNQNWKNSLWSTASNIASKLSGLLTVKANVNGNMKSLPGHKLGLEYVPKDNYVARLHKGERVLTKEENEAYTKAENTNNSNTQNTINYGNQINYDKMANAMLKALTGCKFSLEEDGIARIVKDELYKVV